MPYRGPDARRNARNEVDNMLRHAGFTATWRQYISASAGADDAGLGSALYYREQTITALYAPIAGEAVGMLEAGGIVSQTLRVATQQALGQEDELLWMGERYRVESDTVPSRMNGLWLNTLQRGG